MAVGTRQRMTAWGVGPRLALSAAPYIVLAVALHVSLPRIFLITRAPHPAFLIAGIAFIIGGISLWASGGRIIDRAFKEGRLLTTGPYALVRHPMYSGVIVFVGTGVALCLRSWILLTVPLVGAILFRLLIRREESYLEEKFGQQHRDYKARVGALIPFIRPWK